MNLKQDFKAIRTILKEGIKEKDLRCKNCNRVMKEYEGKYGKFIGCPNFAQDENCKDTFSVNKGI